MRSVVAECSEGRRALGPVSVYAAGIMPRGSSLTVPGGGASFRPPSGSAASMSIIDSRRARKGIIALLVSVLLLLAGGCAAVPYQEMSDARQAIESAEAVVTEGDDGDTQLRRARELLSTAEERLHAGDNGAARDMAERAKSLAIEAREQSGAED